jgi:hypothetical protein
MSNDNFSVYDGPIWDIDQDGYLYPYNEVEQDPNDPLTNTLQYVEWGSEHANFIMEKAVMYMNTLKFVEYALSDLGPNAKIEDIPHLKLRQEVADCKLHLGYARDMWWFDEMRWVFIHHKPQVLIYSDTVHNQHLKCNKEVVKARICEHQQWYRTGEKKARKYITDD